jgi:hypothetical protein
VPEKNILSKDILKAAGALAALSLVLVSSCSRNGQGPVQPTRAVSYAVSFHTVDSLHVEATISPDPDQRLQKILFPPFDADNPVLTLTGRNIHNLSVSGAAQSGPLGFSAWARDSVQSILVVSSGSTFTIDYDVTFPYGPNGSERLKTILPGRFGPDDGYFQGNYVFCVPEYGPTKMALWRAEMEAQVSIEPPAVKKAYGIPSGEFVCSTVYELFFIQWALTSQASQCGGSLTSLITLSARQPEPQLVSLVCNDVSATEGMCASFFPGMAYPRTVIFQDSGSGMEGLFSFYMYNWTAEAYGNSFRFVVPHEMLHGWVGIRTGELDDPWWKEGTAQYLGLVLASGIGFSKDTLRAMLVKDLSENPMVRSHGLSEPYVRDHIYDRDTGLSCAVLVYQKGAQANMILDKRIRDAAQNTATLLSKTGDLCRRYDHCAFSRAQFKACLENGTGLDLADFFARYVDAAGALDTAVLSSAFAWLDSCGAFGK